MNVSMSPSPTRRRFTLLDAMILVAVTAVGCAMAGGINAYISLNRGQVLLDPIVFLDYFKDGDYRESALLAMPLVMPVAAAWTLALIPLGLAKPRPKLRHLASRPGWMACCAFALALAVGLVVIGGLMAILGPVTIVGRPAALELIDLSPILPVLAAPAILAAWLALALGRRRRAEPTWLDRSGRALGVFWVVLGIAGPILLATASF